MRRAFILAALLAIVGLALAGCGGGSGGSTTAGGASSTPAKTTTSGGSGGGGAGAVAVTMKNIAFSPQTVHARVGQKIDWTNDDSVTHNVTATSGASFRSSTFGPGGTYSYTPTSAGTINYVCTIHPGMTGTIVVTR
ncbi:MAG TPA: plastocyanin/azurin family copper-binding protein [Conexibacter sp.]|jgi:plastocyanin|nr:plastocyanin/azurin family copper-binding protein [Conexibacter sp.]